MPSVVRDGLYGPPPGVAPAGAPPAGPAPAPGDPGAPPTGPYAIDDPGEPSQERWDEDFKGAQTQYGKSIRAGVLRELAPVLDELRGEVSELRGMTGSDRHGRMLTSVQAAAGDLDRRAYDEEAGVMASNPHYRNSEEVRSKADFLVAKSMNAAVRFAEDTGNNMPLTRATSKKGLEQTLLLAMHESGHVFAELGGGTPTASVVGAELVASGGSGDGTPASRPLTAEEKEVHQTMYPGKTEQEFRAHMDL
jgi:hypothetical protein